MHTCIIHIYTCTYNKKYIRNKCRTLTIGLTLLCCFIPPPLKSLAFFFWARRGAGGGGRLLPLLRAPGCAPPCPSGRRTPVNRHGVVFAATFHIHPTQRHFTLTTHKACVTSPAIFLTDPAPFFVLRHLQPPQYSLRCGHHGGDGRQDPISAVKGGM